MSWSGSRGCGPGHDPSPPRVEIDRKIPSDVRQIEGIVAQVTRACEAQDFSPRHVHLNIPVALTEALSNAILYGNAGDESRTVRVRALVDDCALVIEVGDEGAGFDLDACTIDPGSGHDLEREDGRGLFLMRRLMDRVERFSSDGNVVRLTLNRP